MVDSCKLDGFHVNKNMKFLPSRTVLLMTLFGSLFFLGIFLNLFPQEFHLSASDQDQHEAQNRVLQVKDIEVKIGLPVRIHIPRIHVDTVIEHVGHNAAGEMDVPKNRDEVAWYEFGQSPGEQGSSVIAGHFGSMNGNGSVFDNLHTLDQGDTLHVEDDTGEIISFVVRESRTYDPHADTADIFSSNDGKSHLNLITCAGDWNETQQRYTNRLVVFTDRI